VFFKHILRIKKIQFSSLDNKRAKPKLEPDLINRLKIQKKNSPSSLKKVFGPNKNTNHQTLDQGIHVEAQPNQNKTNQFTHKAKRIRPCPQTLKT
jgi:hypothetical protein